MKKLNAIEKMILAITASIFLILGGYHLGRQAERDRAWTWAISWTVQEVAKKTDEQLRGTRRVWAIREQSAYDRGRAACWDHR